MRNNVNAAPYDINEFVNPVELATKVLFSHKVDRRIHEVTGSEWFCKEMLEPRVSRLEFLAQELFRAFIPYHPQTKLAVNQQTNITYLLSEAVKGYRHFPEDVSDFTKENYAYSGLGQVLVNAIFLQEIDLKNGNISLDHRGRVIKIDGDWCFASIRDESKFPLKACPITKELLMNLPFPVGYAAYQWLDFKIMGANFPTSDLVDSSLSANRQFNQEIFEAIFKILLTPKIFFERMVDSCISAGGERYLTFLINRRNELAEQARLMPGFQAYLAFENAKQIARLHCKHLCEFAVNKGHKIIPDELQLNFVKAFEQELATLKLPKATEEKASEPETLRVEEQTFEMTLNWLFTEIQSLHEKKEYNRNYLLCAKAAEGMHAQLSEKFRQFKSLDVNAKSDQALRFVNECRQIIKRTKYVFKKYLKPAAQPKKEALAALGLTLTGVGIFYYSYKSVKNYRRVGRFGLFPENNDLGVCRSVKQALMPIQNAYKG